MSCNFKEVLNELLLTVNSNFHYLNSCYGSDRLVDYSLSMNKH